MAQPAQKNSAVCNTKIQTAGAGKGRNWAFTLNNYKEVDINRLTSFGGEYVFQEETGENGTPHLQGLLIYKNAVSFNSVKKLIPRAHIEKCKNKNASIRYCSKEDTRTGNIYENLRDKTYIGTNGTRKKGPTFEEEKMRIILENMHLSKEELAHPSWNEILGFDYLAAEGEFVDNYIIDEPEENDNWE